MIHHTCQGLSPNHFVGQMYGYGYVYISESESQVDNTRNLVKQFHWGGHAKLRTCDNITEKRLGQSIETLVGTFIFNDTLAETGMDGFVMYSIARCRPIAFTCLYTVP